MLRIAWGSVDRFKDAFLGLRQEPILSLGNQTGLGAGKNHTEALVD